MRVFRVALTFEFGKQEEPEMVHESDTYTQTERLPEDWMEEQARAPKISLRAGGESL